MDNDNLTYMYLESDSTRRILQQRKHAKNIPQIITMPIPMATPAIMMRLSAKYANRRWSQGSAQCSREQVPGGEIRDEVV